MAKPDEHPPTLTAVMRRLFAGFCARTLTKSDLDRLIADVMRGDDQAICRAVTFVTEESLGIWHNRARAKLCRYFKNHPPQPADCTRMVDAIVKRLLEGRIYEQTKDQLAMAIRFCPKRLAEAASIAVSSDREYIRRYGHWIQHALKSSSATRMP